MIPVRNEMLGALSPGQHALNQKALELLVRDPEFGDHEGLVETDSAGNPILSPPPSRRHSRRQGRILSLLTQLLPEGEALPEYPISTPEGVKAPDAVWLSSGQAESAEDEVLDAHGPALCVEVRSPANTAPQIRAKIAAYFAVGAEEVWVCDLDGAMAFYVGGHRVERSRLCPGFPDKILPS